MTIALTAEERVELDALAKTNANLAGKEVIPGGPTDGSTFMSRRHWPLYRRMVRAGLVEWGQWANREFDPRRFARVRVTDAGRALLRELGDG